MTTPEEPGSLAPVVGLHGRKTPAEAAKEVKRLHKLLAAALDGCDLSYPDGRSLSLDPARVMVVAWIDANGNAYAEAKSFGPWSDSPEREHQLDAWRNLYQHVGDALSQFRYTPYDPIKANDNHRGYTQRRDAEQHLHMRTSPWLCEWCERRFKTERGAVQHERVCWKRKRATG